MDKRELHGMIEEMVRYSYGIQHQAPQLRARVVRAHDPAKRHATYFPSKASFHSKWNFADDDASTWEFSAPVAATSRSSSSSSSASAYSTPAQEIALQYRAISTDYLETQSSSDSSHESEVSWETAPLDEESLYVPVALETDVKAIHRQSRCNALDDTREEAVAAMIKHGKDEHDHLVCHRPGCRDTVRGVRALMYHLHIHDIHDEILCSTCGGEHDGTCRSTLSLSHNRIKSSPASPFKDMFVRIFGKIRYHAQCA